MAKSKKKTVTQLYQEEIKKLKRRIKSYEKKGFVFSEDIIPEQPKRATRKKVEEIKKLRGKQLALKAEYYEDITGYLYSSEEGVKFLKDKEIARRNKEDYVGDNLWSRVVVSRWFGELEAFHEGGYYRFMYDSMTEILRLLKLNTTAEVIEEMELNGNHVTWEVVYREYDNTVYMSRLLDIVQQKGLEFEQAFSDILELRRWHSEIAESFENWADVL